MDVLIDVTTNILDTNADPEEVARVNEENEWKKRLEDLAKTKRKLDKKILPPRASKRQRTSAIQHRAITRGV